MQKLHDISHYCAKSDIKPEISCVLVSKSEGKLETIATDSYRLARVSYSTNNEAILENIQDGLYHSKAFNILCKVLNAKKSTIEMKMYAVKAFTANKSNLDPKYYPDVKQLFDKVIKPEDVTKGITKKYNINFLVDHLELVAELEEDITILDSVDVSKCEEKRLNSSNVCLTFHNTKADLLLMQINK